MVFGKKLSFLFLFITIAFIHPILSLNYKLLLDKGAQAIAGVAITSPFWLNHLNNWMITKHSTPADKGTENFVKNTLREYNFDKQQINGLSVKSEDFALIGKNSISVPLRSNLLDPNSIAPRREEIGENGFRVYNRWKTKNIYYEELLNKDNKKYIYQMPLPHAIKTWQAVIIHEGTHWQRNADKRLFLTTLITGSIGYHTFINPSGYINRLIQKQLPISDKWYSNSLTLVPRLWVAYIAQKLLLLTIHKYEEYYADKGVIATKDPALLSAIRDYFYIEYLSNELSNNLKPHNRWSTSRFLSDEKDAKTHPNLLLRAYYFEQALKKVDPTAQEYVLSNEPEKYWNIDEFDNTITLSRKN